MSEREREKEKEQKEKGQTRASKRERERERERDPHARTHARTTHVQHSRTHTPTRNKSTTFENERMHLLVKESLTFERPPMSQSSVVASARDFGTH